MPNSAASPHSERGARAIEALAVAGFLSLVAVIAAWWFFRNGYILYYGDAQAHLNISRSIVDSKTPGYDQLGTVWLPALHLLCLPFVTNDWLWKTGVAGTIPVAVCFVVAGTFFYLAARESYQSRVAAAVVVLCFALNPNVLYLGSIPMTEVVFLAALAMLLFSILRFGATQKMSYLLPGVAATWWASLTRYDGWFLIPFAALWFAFTAVQRRWVIFVFFGALASLAPLYWMAHNWWETGNALDFYNGPYSAKAIQGSAWYPGFHDWPVAVRYYAAAGRMCSGTMLIFLGAAGAILAATKRCFAPVLFLMLTPAFYIWSIHSSGNPVFLPQLWGGYYNSRYGIAVVVLCAFAAGAIARALPGRYRSAGLLLPLAAIAPWLIHPSKENWVVWKESEVNSVARRAWTREAGSFFTEHYRPGQGILTNSGTGDISGIFCETGIPLREVLHIGNGPAFLANSERPDLLDQEIWAVAQQGDSLSKKLARPGAEYRIVEDVRVTGAPVLEIYRRGQAQ